MKPLVKTLAGAIVLTSVLAGCASKATGTDSAAAGSGNPPASQSTTTDATSAPNSAASSAAATTPGTQTSGGPAPSKSSGTPGTKPSAATTDQIKYTSPEGVTVSADGRTLATPVEWGGCTEQPQLLVTAQDATQVVVEVKTVTHFRMGAMCPNIARTGEAAATLNAPLGNRQVIDAVTHSVVRTH